MLTRAFVIVLALALWQPASAAARSVREFGAVGDGRADDTVALQKAADAGGAIEFPRGAYRVTKPIVVDLRQSGFTSFDGRGVARLIMEGAGPALRIEGTHDGTADPETVKPPVWDRQRMPTLRGLEIVGKHAAADGVAALGAMQLLIDGVNIRRVRHAVLLQKRNRNVIVANSHFYENSGVGLYLDDVNLHQINVSNSHISYNRLGGIVVRGGNVRNLQVTGCDIEGNMGDNDAANILLDCQQGSIAEVAIVGCTIQHSHKSAGTANIRMLAEGEFRRGGKTQPAKYGVITIADNVLSDVHYNIDLQGARGVSITGNTIWKGFTANIRLKTCAHVVVGANVLDRNPRYQEFADAKNAVLIEDCENVNVNGLQLFGGRDARGGLIVSGGRRIQITNTTVLDCDGPEVALRNVLDSRVSDCLLADDRQRDEPSLSVVGGRRIMIVDNHLDRPPQVDPRGHHVRGNFIASDRDEDAQGGDNSR
ncbi:MAG: right-handed parallel beta-helix repeat-containing protein [Pirellulaceae bacterium]|nr:right-handed parallel beta-helix repeat-containing protein [Pirellulaceae bacterium]